MSEVISFPAKPSPPNHVKTPEQALQYVLDAIRDGEAKAENLVIMWSEEETDHIAYRYIVGGTGPMSSTVGLLEITKASMIG